MLAVYPSSRSWPVVLLPPVTAVSLFPSWVAKTHFNHWRRLIWLKPWKTSSIPLRALRLIRMIYLQPRYWPESATCLNLVVACLLAKFWQCNSDPFYFALQPDMELSWVITPHGAFLTWGVRGAKRKEKKGLQRALWKETWQLPRTGMAGTPEWRHSVCSCSG